MSIVMFLLLIDRTANQLRVANVVQRLDVAARRVFDTVYPTSESEAAAAAAAARSISDAPPVQVVRNDDVGGVFVTLDRDGLARIAENHDAVIELVHAVGDHVRTDLVVGAPRRGPTNPLNPATPEGATRAATRYPGVGAASVAALRCQ